ncbi:MAG: hypothetical protein IPH66_11880 [Crocinitomicaceae bacterium]|nr:hypothetical protein [Crocinitomicaceae bacterium]
MSSVLPYIKIGCVVLVCAGMVYANHILFTQENFIEGILSQPFFLIPGIAYLPVIYFFAKWFYQKKYPHILSAWILFNAAICVNFFMYVAGLYPPLPIQFAQSTLMFIYCVLLLFSKENFPNWLRLFSLANLLILIPCLIFYFTDFWAAYEITIYLLCFTPIIQSFIFLKEISRLESDILDA